jgi:hypothetical protein
MAMRNIWDILWPFGTFCVYLVYFSGFGNMHQEKSGNPGMYCLKEHDRVTALKLSPRRQGCQIFLGTTFQNWKNIPNDHKMVIKYTIWP